MKIHPQQPEEVNQAQSEALLESKALCAQRKLDGERCIVEIKGGVQSAYGKRGNELETQPMDCTRDCIMDGELVKGEFIAFDLLSFKGKSLHRDTFTARFHLLKGLDICPVVETEFIEIQTFIENARLMGWEGVVLKDLQADYRIDGRDYEERSWKLKFKKSASFIVIRHNEAESVGIATVDGVERGNVAIRGASMMKLGTVIDVEFLYVHKSGKLCQPIFQRERTDCLKSRCFIPPALLVKG